MTWGVLFVCFLAGRDPRIHLIMYESSAQTIGPAVIHSHLVSFLIYQEVHEPGTTCQENSSNSHFPPRPYLISQSSNKRS